MAMAANSAIASRATGSGRIELPSVARRGNRRTARAVASPDKPKSSGVSIQIDEPFRKPANQTGIPAVWPSVEEMTNEAIAKAMQQESGRGEKITLDDSYKRLLTTAYEKCGSVTEIYAKTFHLGTMLMTPERQRAIWAIYLWCRRTDELVDGPNSTHITPTALDRWEERLQQIFEGRPYDLLDAALSDIVSIFPLGIQPFIDMIEGMRMDLHKSRYETFEELYLYCYRVAGTVGLMSTPVMGIAKDSFLPTEKVYEAALALGIANQLTNILRDVGEDRERGRIYVPTKELEQFGYTEEDLMNGVLDDRWRNFMKFQIARARQYFDKAEEGVFCLAPESRFPVYASLVIYRNILNKIEENDYDNFTKRAYVPKWQKMAYLPLCYVRASLPASFNSPAIN